MLTRRDEGCAMVVGGVVVVAEREMNGHVDAHGWV